MEASFDNITVPIGTNFGALAAWYKLNSYNPVDGQEIAITGAHVQMLPCDVEGDGDATTAAGNAATWGDRYGNNACIVVGVNLPGVMQTWTAAPALFPGMGATGTRITAQMLPDYILRQGFPTGKLNDAQVWRRDIVRAFGVNVARVGIGRTLDVALCVNPNLGTKPFNNVGSARTLCGYAQVNIHGLIVGTGSPFGSNPQV